MLKKCPELYSISCVRQMLPDNCNCFIVKCFGMHPIVYTLRPLTLDKNLCWGEALVYISVAIIRCSLCPQKT